MELRKAYVAEMARLMKQNDKIFILDADLSGAGGTKTLYQQFPERCVQCGIAEANMTCIAAGLSASGFVPFIHSFAPFSTRRVYDQIAVSISYSEQNVKIVGFDPGIETTYNGGTHMCFEDFALMRALPNFVVMDIVDDVQLTKALPHIAQHKGSVYFRMVRKQNKQFFGEDYNFQWGKANKICSGTDVTIVATGTTVFDAKVAVEKLAQVGISAELLAIHTVKPLDEQAILQSAQKTGVVVTVENHSVHGGLYSAVCELLSAKHPTLCGAIAVHDQISQVGSLNDLKIAYHLTADDIASKAQQLVQAKRG